MSPPKKKYPLKKCCLLIIQAVNVQLASPMAWINVCLIRILGFLDKNTALS